MFYHVVRRSFLLFAAPFLRFRVECVERLPAKGPVVVIAPHRSWLDPPVVGAACPRLVRFLIVDHVYRKRGQMWFYRRMQSLPVKSGGSASLASLREALRYLRGGGVIGVFPEGRVVKDQELGDVRAGAAMLALRTGAAIVPISIRGTAEAWPHGQKLPRTGRVSARFEEPLYPPGRREPQALERTLDMIRAALVDAVAPEDAPGPHAIEGKG